MRKFIFFLTIVSFSYLNAQITAGPITDQIICDSSFNNGFDRIDLTTFDFEALGNQDPNFFSVSYHETQQDAINSTNPVFATDYTNISNPQTMFVRVEDRATGVGAVTTLELFVVNQPTASGVTAVSVCTTSNTAGAISFYINDVESIVQQLSANSGNIQVSYFYSQTDAYTDLNQIPTNSLATLVSSGSNVFRRYFDPNFPECFGVESVDVLALTCSPSQLQDLEICEDANGLGCFDLSVNSNLALAGNSTNTHTVTYHLTQADADNNTNALISPYCAPIGSQQIIVRVEENAVGIADTSQSFFATVHATPNVFSFTPIVGCDDDGNGFIEYDASSTIDTVLNNSTNFSNVQLTYYLTDIDALNQVNPIGVHFNFNVNSGTSLVYVRTEFQPSLCSSVSPLQLIENTNCFSIGDPNDLTGCLQTPNTVACFDLTQNDLPIIGNNNPSDFTVSYYPTNSDAIAGTNPISNTTNICVGWNGVVWSRLEETATGSYQVTDFDLIVQLVAFDTTSLTDLSKCDDDLDNSVIFNLTDFASQLNTSNTITYYPTSQDAQNGTNVIQNPTAFNILVANGRQQVFLLEAVANGCDIIHLGTLRPLGNCNNAYDCANAQSLCERIGQPFVNVFDGSTATLDNYYPFSSNTGPRNPTWFYIPIETSGDLTLEVYQNTQPDFTGQGLDIDFAIYGPFTSPTSQCGNLTQADYVDHSFSVDMPEIGQINNAQAGEYYLILTSNFSSVAGFLKVELGAASTATINCDGIEMNSYLDTNLNGVVDATDPSFPLGVFTWEKNMNGSVMQVSAPTGSYSIYDIDPTNSYDLGYSVLPAYASNYTVSPASYPGVTIPSGSGVVNKDFLITPVTPYEDVVIYILPQNQPRPGFTYTETVYYTNLGTMPVPVGQVDFDYDPLLSIVNVTDPAAVITPGNVSVNYSNLVPFEIRSFDVEMQIPVIPTVNLGDVLTNLASITPVTNDLTPSNNTSTSAQIIIGSYDPNDKMESRGEFIDPSSFNSEDYFYYTIRFQNTGTASAINVRIEDTMDAQLDWDSIEIINSSHAYIMERMENKLTWRFDNIMLPDSTTDESGSNGYVYFKVKPLTGWTEGTLIPNTAEIYFDFNPAIITNTFRSTFQTPLSIPDIEETMFSLTPNPADNQITVNFNDVVNENANLTLYDVRGRVTLSRKLTQNQLQIDISELKQGIYLTKFTNGEQTFTSKLVKK